MFNLRNRVCLEAFSKETEENLQLVECLENDLPFEIQCRKWLKTFNATLHKCFKKVRVVNNDKKKDTNEILLQERVDLKKEGKLKDISDENRINIEERIAQIEEQIGEETLENMQKKLRIQFLNLEVMNSI